MDVWCLSVLPAIQAKILQSPGLTPRIVLACISSERSADYVPLHQNRSHSLQPSDGAFTWLLFNWEAEQNHIFRVNQKMKGKCNIIPNSNDFTLGYRNFYYLALLAEKRGQKAGFFVEVIQTRLNFNKLPCVGLIILEFSSMSDLEQHKDESYHPVQATNCHRHWTQKNLW